MELYVLTSIPENYTRDIKKYGNNKEGMNKALAGLRYRLPNYYPAFDDISSLCVGSVILGTDNPLGIRNVIATWNKTNATNLILELQKFEYAAGEKNFTSVSEYLTSLVQPDGSIGDVSYPASLADLKTALDAVCNVFTYGSKSMIALDVNYKRTSTRTLTASGVYLSSDVIRYVSAHPEEFMIVVFDYE